ncbi:NLR family CARD domain-containing protein 3 [Aulostomus maculatus]
MMDDIELGDAASAGGESMSYEDDELYYIPERRPSLDLGPNPMDTSHWHYVERAISPVLSYSSMTSEEVCNQLDEDDGFITRVQLQRSDSYSSCYSLDSDDCEKKTPKLKTKDEATSEPCDTPELIREPNETRHPSLTVKFTLMAICKTLQKLSEEGVRRFRGVLWKGYPQLLCTSPLDVDIVDMVDKMLTCYSLEVSLQITRTVLEEIGGKKAVDYLGTLCLQNEVCHDLKETLRKMYGEVCEDVSMQGEKRPFDDIFTDLTITSTCDNGPNIEHEVVTIEKLDSNQETGKLLSTKDILSEEQLEVSNNTLTLVMGVAGSGKSMAVKKLIHDWIEERSHQHVSFLFPLPFQELKQFEGAQVSLVDIVQKLYPETKKLREEDYRSKDCTMMFVFDGLDEYNGRLDFKNTELVCDHTNPSSLNVIVVNILRGKLLYHSLVMVTSRPQVKHCIPWDTRYNEIEVRGFSDPEKDEYFKKRFKDPEQAAAVIAYVKSIKTLYIMCHLPVFCSLVANECQHRFKEAGQQAELPRSISYMYTRLLLVLMRQYRGLRAPHHHPDEEVAFVMKLGQFAFNMLEKGKYKITELEWKEAGMDEEGEAIIKSGLCTQYVTQPHVLFQEKAFSFIHPTMQEYLAALYAFLSFRNQEKNVFEHQRKRRFPLRFKEQKGNELFRNAVDRSLLCEDGKLDIFLRFLCGMSLKANLELLKPFCCVPLKWQSVSEDVAVFIRKRISEDPSRTENLQRCLEELDEGAQEAATGGEHKLLEPK